MSNLFRVLILTMFFSFLWGVWWSVYKMEQGKPHYRSGPEIRLLALEGVFTPEFLAYFQKNNRIQLVVAEKSTESDLLREALTHNDRYDIIQFPSFISKSFILSNVFVELQYENIENFKNISVDFKGLDFDLENKYVLPISWGVNGFITKSDFISTSQDLNIQKLSLAESKASFFAHPAELFRWATLIKPIIKTWVETGQTNELNKELKEVSNQLKNLSYDSRAELRDGKSKVIQATNGQAAQFMSANSGGGYKFLLPQEGATLWLQLLGISRGVNDLDFTHHVLNQLLNKNMNEKFVIENEQSSVLPALDESELPEMQKARYVRIVPLSKIDFYIHPEAYEPSWLEAIKQAWPAIKELESK